MSLTSLLRTDGKAIRKSYSTQEQGPAEPLPQVPQRIRHPLVFPEGCTITQALKIALGSDTTKTSAPTLATITTSAGADKSANEVYPGYCILPLVYIF